MTAKAIGIFLRDHVWKSYKSTLLGLVVSAATDLLLQLQHSQDPKWHLVAALILAPFLAWKDKAVADGTVKLPGAGTPGGSGAGPGAGGAAVLVLLSSLALGTGALAEDKSVVATPPPSRIYGGCFAGGKVCVAPSASLTMVAINLSTKVVEGAFSPGIGVGFTAYPDQWFAFGADGFLSLDPGANKATVAFMGKFLSGYLRVGVSKGLIGDSSWRIPVAFGVDL